MTGAPQLRVTCRPIFVFEVGWAIDLDAAARTLGAAGERQVPGNPKVGYTQLYGAPGTAGVSILTT